MNDDDSTVPVPLIAWIFPAVIHGVLAFSIFARLLTSGSRYARIFADFNLKLPEMTEVFVMLAYRVESNFFTLLIVLPMAWVLDALVLWLMGGWSRFEGQMWFWVGVALLLLTLGVMEVSFFLPYYKLQEALSR